MRLTLIKFITGIVTCLIFIIFPISSYSWHNQTHLAVAKASGYEDWYYAAGADIAKIKAGNMEKLNHYYDNYESKTVTEKLIFDQVKNYNNPNDEEGHLYGAIIASLREYKKDKSSGKYAEFHLSSYATHYIGDLSEPLHNVIYDGFNKSHHNKNDGIVEEEVLDKISEIQKHMYKITLRAKRFEEDLAKEIARIANISRQLGLKLRAENRDMTKEEAYTQLGHSASLLKSVLDIL